jgi:hypothetical protein
MFRFLALALALAAPLSAQTAVPAETRADARVAAALWAEITRNGPPEGLEGESRYFYNRVDLNGDGRPEVVAHVVSPYVCGSGGCATYVLRETGGRYVVASSMTLGRTPVVVSPRRTNGWRDLIVPVSGGGVRGGFRVLRFDGRRYPSNPSVQPPAPEAQRRAGTAYLGGDAPLAGGIPLRPAR